ncbi:hypothetical protein ACFFK7_10930 [Pseudoalteromonas xiamenensis]
MLLFQYIRLTVKLSDDTHGSEIDAVAGIALLKAKCPWFMQKLH